MNGLIDIRDLGKHQMLLKPGSQRCSTEINCLDRLAEIANCRNLLERCPSRWLTLHRKFPAVGIDSVVTAPANARTSG